MVKYSISKIPRSIGAKDLFGTYKVLSELYSRHIQFYLEKVSQIYNYNGYRILLHKVSSVCS